MKKSFIYIENSNILGWLYWANYVSNFSLLLPKPDAGSIKKLMATHKCDFYRVQM